jgi:pyridoxal phosphate enzyme (YggS family)
MIAVDFDPAELEAIAVARAAVLARVETAARKVGRDPAGVRLVTVTKTVAPERVRAAIAAGLDVIGENRVQEAETKKPFVAGATWHLIGPLQSNKARRAVETFDVIESVESLDLARRLDRLAGEHRAGRPMPALLQVNVDADPDKAGFRPATLERDAAELLDLTGLDFDGLMTIGRLSADPESARATFVALRRLSDRLRTRDPRLGPELSMGMTDDYPVAVEEGATIIRIGRALFGNRP